MNTFDITVIIPTKNSQDHLTNCLESVKPCRRIIIIDSKSTDETITIGKEFGAEIVSFNWNKRYPKKRQWALDNIKISTEWILFLDSDEIINESFYSAFKNKIADSSYNGAWIKFENFFMGKNLKFGVPQKKLSLMRNRFGVFENFGEHEWTDFDMEIHEHLLIKGKCFTIHEKQKHLQASSYDDILSKHYEYAKWESKRSMSFVKNSKTTFREIIKYNFIKKRVFAYLYFFLNYFLLLGFLDGRAGYKYSLIKFKYFSKIYEIISYANK